MALTTEQINELAADVMAKLSETRTPFPGNKADLVAAIMWADSHQDANAASYNAGLPDSIRTGADGKLKSNIYSFVADKKWEVA